MALFWILSTFYNEDYNQHLVISPKKLSTLFLFINKVEKKATITQPKIFFIGVEL